MSDAADSVEAAAEVASVSLCSGAAQASVSSGNSISPPSSRKRVPLLVNMSGPF